MAPIQVKTRFRLSRAGARLLLYVTLAGCTAVVLWVPVRVVPDELPPLVLLPSETRVVEAADREAASRAPSTPEANALRAIVGEASRAERGAEPLQANEARRLRAAVLRRALVDGSGIAAVGSLRSEATLRFARYLEGTLPRAEHDEVVGALPDRLASYGVIVEGVLVAPPLVARALFKARWNHVVGLPFTSGFGRSEQQAYWGWLALHAVDAPHDLRLDAFTRFERLGGRHAAETRAILLYAEGLPETAGEAFFTLHTRTGGLRYRNHAAAAYAGM